MLKNLKKQVYEANIELVHYNLVLFTWGNVSAIDSNRELVVIKPSGISYYDMKPKDMVVVNIHGNKVEGKYKPSSDTATHLELYKAFPATGAVVHTHSTFATAWAQAGKPIPVLGTTHADYFAHDIPCTDDMSEDQIKGNYEQETGVQICRCFKNNDPQHVPGVLVKNHGPFTWGKTASEAVHTMVVLEELAWTAYLSLQINPKSRINQILVDKHFNRKHGKDAYYGQ